MEARRAALVEIGGSHDECLYSQLLILKHGGYHTTLICDDNVRARLGDVSMADEVMVVTLKGRSVLQRMATLLGIRSRIVGQGIKTVIFNTAEGSDVRDLCIMHYPDDIGFYGTMHNLRKVKGSMTQKVINRRIDHYFLLNDYLIEKAQQIGHKRLKFAAYYPIFFPRYGEVPVAQRKAGELWIAIPGQVEYKRRDYPALVAALAAMSQRPALKFVLPGKSMHEHGNGAELKQLLAEHGLTDMFLLWDGFVDNETYHTYLRHCDVVMPLLHPGNDGYDGYLNLQISGAFNAAFAYKKPLLMHRDFSGYADFQENAVFYDVPSLGSTMLQLPELTGERKAMYKDEKWTLEAQAARYLSFIK